MATQQPIAGVAYCKADGVQYALRGSFTIDPTAVTREGVAGMDGVHGFKETPKIPQIKAQISDMGDLSLQALGAMTNSTITAELANGKVYILANAWQSGELSLNTGDGTTDVTWQGLRMSEVTA